VVVSESLQPTRAELVLLHLSLLHYITDNLQRLFDVPSPYAIVGRKGRPCRPSD
jgi:hypothetical protein